MTLLLVLIPIAIASVTGIVVLSWKLASQGDTGSQEGADLVASDGVVVAEIVDEAPPMEFKLTDAARDKVRELMVDIPDATHLIVSLNYNGQFDFDYNYDLSLGSDKSPREYVFLKSNGIDVAVARDNVKALNGTTLDWVQRETGEVGFDFYNPNPFDWREGRKVTVEQTRDIDPAIEAKRLMTPQRKEAYERLRLWWLANESKSGILHSEEIALVESYTVDGEEIYIIFSDEPGKPVGGFCLVDARGRTIPVFSGYNYLSEKDKFVDVNGDGIPEIITATTWGTNEPDNPRKAATNATGVIVLPIGRTQQPLLQIVFDKRHWRDPGTWTWELDTSDEKGAIVKLYPSPGGPPIAEFKWEPEQRAFSGPPGSKEEGFIARAGHLPFEEEVRPFIAPDR